MIKERTAILTIIIVGIAAMIPMMVWGIPSGGDLPNHLRFAQPFFESIRNGNFYPGWLAESNYGFGDARFRFYPPGLYYLLALFKSGFGWYAASLFTFTLLSVVGGLGTYFWARLSYSTNVAMCAGVIYTLAPYHLNELYQASLLSEYAACSVLPFLFAFVERTCRRKSAADVAGLAASYALLVLTHLPLTVIGSLAVALYALLLVRRERCWSTLSRLTVGVVIGLAASAFFWATMLAELPWIKGNSANQNIYYDYRANFLFSPSALTNRNTWYANLLALAVLGFLLPAVVLFKRRTMNRFTLAVAVVTIASLLMTTELSRPLWFVIPKLKEVQFPWRWLAITSLFGSILLAASLPVWQEIWRQKIRPLHLVPALAVVLSLFFVATQVIWDSEYLRQPEFNSLLVSSRGSASFKDWMPRWADGSTQTFAPSELVKAGSRKVSVTNWEPEHRVFKIDAGPDTTALIRTFYYPLWTAKFGERSISTRPGKDGALIVDVPAEATTISLDFVQPSHVNIVRVVSIIGWLTIVALFLGARFNLSFSPR
ncbi:MAG TPA: 6-pyruvoyl-tetrahydropterin synthase-related protein [Pyrinomonadaceae bacterium]|nr:6-pyruvoyl-tetrahydropterin synthase-related protein [Pyrinomonadaceae bacterium]